VDAKVAAMVAATGVDREEDDEEDEVSSRLNLCRLYGRVL
jgi:hypothetical protein